MYYIYDFKDLFLLTRQFYWDRVEVDNYCE